MRAVVAVCMPYTHVPHRVFVLWRVADPSHVGLPKGLSKCCFFCGAALDADGDQVLCCKFSGFHGRHNLLRSTVADLLRDSGCEWRTDVPFPGSGLVQAVVSTPISPSPSPWTDWTSGKPRQWLVRSVPGRIVPSDTWQKRLLNMNANLPLTTSLPCTARSGRAAVLA